MRAHRAIDPAATTTAWRHQLALLVALAASTAASAADDAIEGRWLGTIGSPKERIETGLEFRRDAGGKLVVRTTQPILNLYDFDNGPNVVVERDGDKVRIEALYLDLTLKGDTLEGFYPGPNSPATLRRVSRLPKEAPIPKFPAGPGPRWETRLNGLVYASPIVAGDTVYVGTSGGVMNAIATSDGSSRWTFAAGRAIHGAALVDGDALYFTADNGFLFKLDRATGKESWRYDLGDSRVDRVLPHPLVYSWDWQGAEPVIAEGTVFVGAGDGGFHAVDAKTGAKRWRFDTRGRIRNGAAIAGANVIVGSADHFVYALDRASGREVWRADSGAEIDATPVVHEDRVLVGNRGAGLISLDAATGESKWRLFFWGSWVESTPVVRDGTIYIGASDLRRVSAIDFTDGHVLWRSDAYGWTWGTPLVTDDRVYVGAAGGTPYFIRHQASFSVLERKTGRILSRWPLPDTGGHQWGIAGSPARAGTDVIVATIAGSLLAFPMR